MIAEALLHLVRGIVSRPESVRVRSSHMGYKVTVHAADYGRTIGRQGRTAKSLRTVAAALNRGPLRIEIVSESD